jgi:prepilin-type N-terminal cleavage/methylation domain-containing protein
MEDVVRNRRLTGRRAFTLVEILMVVIILGIAGAIIVPQIGSRNDLRAAAAARLLISDITYAQNRAIAQQKKHYVRFVNQTYSVCDSIALTPIAHPLKPAQSNGLYQITFGANGTTGLDQCAIGTVDFGSQTVIGFNDLGEPFAFDGVTESPLTSPGTIIVQSGDVSLTIQIEPFTGEASVQ